MPVGTVILENANKTFLLYGETGEYDDHRIWVFGAFHSHQRAEEYRQVLQDDAANYGIPIDSSMVYEFPCPDGLLDQGLKDNWMEYGVEYSVGAVKVI